MEWLRFDENEEVQLVAEEVKLVPELQAINTLAYNKQEGDHQGRNRVRAKQELKYLYLTYSMRSPYRDYSDDEREQQARIDCNFNEKWKPSSELEALIKKYKEGTPNKIARLLTTVKKFLDKFEKHLNEIDLNERNSSSGAVIHSPKSIMETLERLPRLAETLQELENQVKLGTIATVRSKGDHELGWMNKNNKVIQKKDESFTNN